MKFKDLASLFAFFLQIDLYKVYLVRIKEVAKTGAQLEPIIMSTVCWKTLPLKQNKCVVNQLKHFDDISFRELFRSIRVDLYKKKDVSLPKTKYLYLRWTNSFSLSFRFEYGIIERRTQVIYEISYGRTTYNTILWYRKQNSCNCVSQLR